MATRLEGGLRGSFKTNDTEGFIRAGRRRLRAGRNRRNIWLDYRFGSRIIEENWGFIFGRIVYIKEELLFSGRVVFVGVAFPERECGREEVGVLRRRRRRGWFHKRKK